MPNATSTFQNVMLKSASTQSLPHCPFGTARRCPPALRTANKTPEPKPRHKVRNVQGGTSASATFMAVQLKPQASVSAASSHHRRCGR